MNDLACTRHSARLPIRIFSAFAIAAIASLSAATLVASGESRSSAFASENAAAMTKMMSGMNVPASGDIDRDFAAMMTAHHQGAIDMAVSELRYGSSTKLRRIAQGIVVEQQQEIAAMRLALEQPGLPSTPAFPDTQPRCNP